MSDEHAMRDAWDAFGGGYDQAFSSSFTAIARVALRFADVQPGMRLLDVAAGSGALSIPAAELGAEVLATDLSPGMLDLLRARAEEAGVTGIRTAVMDGTDLDLEDLTFERVCSQFGVMLFPDSDAGLREMFRVTAIGGLGVVVIFGRPEHVMPIWFCEQALHSALPDLELPPGNRLQTDPMSLAEAMSTAGFAEVTLQKLDLSVEVGSPPRRLGRHERGNGDAPEPAARRAGQGCPRHVRRRGVGALRTERHETSRRGLRRHRQQAVGARKPQATMS